MNPVIVFIISAVCIVILSFAWHRIGRKSHSNHMNERIKTQQMNLHGGKDYSRSEVDKILTNLLRENYI